MTIQEKKFRKTFNELKSKNGNTEYYMTLFHKGVEVGVIYANGTLDLVNIEERGDHLLICDDNFGIFVDCAEVRSI